MEHEEKFKMCKTFVKKEDLPLDDLPQMFSRAGVTFQDGDEERVIKTIASDGSVDRDGDILDPRGWGLKEFKKNPLFLWMHDMMEPPIGAVIDVFEQPKAEKPKKSIYEVKGDDLDLDMGHLDSELIAFSTFARTAKADELLILFKSGMLRAVSVRFKPREIKDMTEEMSQQLGLGMFGMFFKKQDLLELSAVTIPSNMNAIVTAKSSYEKHFSKFVDRLDEILNSICERVETLKTVNDREKRFDEIVDRFQAFVEKEPHEKRAAELYPGVRGSESTLDSLLQLAESGVSRLDGAKENNNG